MGAILYRRYRGRHDSTGPLDSWARVGIGLLILGIVLQMDRFDEYYPITLTAALPLLCFVAIPPVGTTDSQRVARIGMVSLAVLEFMVAFPFAGIQLHWASFLIVPVGVLCIHDGIHQLRPEIVFGNHRGQRMFQVTFVSALTSIIVLAGFGWLALAWHRDLWAERHEYRANTKLNLPGSDLIRLPSWQATTMENLSYDIRLHCSSFVTQPQMNSFYFWTGQSPPQSWLNVWYYKGDASLQQQIAKHTRGHNQSEFCVVDNPHWWAWWAQGRLVPQLPLTQLVESFKLKSYPPLLFDGGYRLYVPQSSSLAGS